MRILLDTVIHEFPEIEYRLCAHAIVKLQGGNVTALSREEKNAIYIFKLESDEENENEEYNIRVAECAFRRQKVQQEREHEYSDTRSVVLRSNISERLVSSWDMRLATAVEGVTPAHFECQVFLNANRDLSGPDDWNRLCIA